MEFWPVPKAVTELLEKCEIHADEKFRFFYELHTQLCCITCITQSHRQCSKLPSVTHATI
ncbi:hypothetical protein DPMN_076849 [Dreissena polymorpha]|uniref:Uncharacterized protein n=1 Tax=Dreissena polymorpha TaxID=45954 RepID=A0A9D4BNS2_DREPO|nr:hypothetical protein DPMN_076849 [Dreissena polymorpha]